MPFVFLFCPHQGRRYTYEACTRPFVTLPAVRDSPEFDGLVFNFDLIYSIITKKVQPVLIFVLKKKRIYHNLML